MRKKIEYRWIESDSARRASLKKRRLGLVKKVSELSTLCGVDASLIIYGPDDQQPTTWPSPEQVQENLARFYDLPEIDRNRKMMEQDTYLKERVKKLEEQCKKYQRKNKEIEFSDLMHIYQGNASNELDVNDLNFLIQFAQEKREEIKRRIDCLQQGHLFLGSLQLVPSSGAPPTLNAQASKPELNQMAPPYIGGNVDVSNHDHNGETPLDTTDGSIPWEQWFVDMMNNKNDMVGSSSMAKGDDHMIQLNDPCQSYSLSDANQLGLVDFSNYESCFGGTSGGNQTELMDYGNLSSYFHGSNGVQTIMGLQPHEGFNGMIHTSGMPMSQSQPLSHIGGNNYRNDFTTGMQQLDGMSTTLPPSHFEGKSNGNDFAAGLQPLGNNGTHGAGDAGYGNMTLPFEFHGGNFAANDIGLPYGVTQQWHNNFHP